MNQMLCFWLQKIPNNKYTRRYLNSIKVYNLVTISNLIQDFILVCIGIIHANKKLYKQTAIFWL